MTAAPEEKAHATWSASATTRNVACSGALALAEQLAHLEKESEAAAWGTACHTVSEMCLNNKQDAIEYVDRVIKTKEREVECDEEMADTAQTYIDYVRGRYAYAAGGGKALLFIEQKFTLDKIKPPFDAGGTADAVIYFPDEEMLEVIDLKGGRGVKVNVFENKQLRTYALGAMLANPGLKVKKIRSTIVQPRINHKDGAIRSETYHVVELMEWTADILVSMTKSAAAKAAYQRITGELTRDQWAENYLTPGDHCKDTFCPARGACPALKKQAFEKCGLWFNDESQAVISNTPSEMSPEELEKVLDAADLVTDYFNAARALASSLYDSGVVFPNYHKVDKIGRRRFIDKDNEEALAKQLFLKADLTKEDIYVPKMRTSAQLEKVLGKKREHLLADLIEAPITGTNFVRKDKSSRPETKAGVHKHFTAIEE